MDNQTLFQSHDSKNQSVTLLSCGILSTVATLHLSNILEFTFGVCVASFNGELKYN